tara:strand:- start:594 stop:2567 length:1974 start_codon:yes stop_codon:yes gene_type:complete
MQKKLFEIGTETDRMFADAERMKREREVGKTEQFSNIEQMAKGVKPLTAGDVAYGTASMLPISGDVIAYKEAPEDLERVYELLEKGYKQEDIVKLGLGGALGVLTAIGLIPGVGFVGRLGKSAIQGVIKRYIQRGNVEEAADLMVKTSRAMNNKATQNKQSEKRLLQIAEARNVFKGKGSAKERREYLKGANKPQQTVVYHGSKSLQDKATSAIDSEKVTRKAKILDEGFGPYTSGTKRIGKMNVIGTEPFIEARGLISSGQSGYHGEIRDVSALSTSRDPLMSANPTFTLDETLENTVEGIANRDSLVMQPSLKNLLYAEIPRDKFTSNMTDKAYDELVGNLEADGFMKDALLKKYFEGGSGTLGASKLPKSSHTEAEIAISFPEYLKPKSVTDAPIKSQLKIGKGDVKKNVELSGENLDLIEDELKETGKLTIPGLVKQGQRAYNKVEENFKKMETQVPNSYTRDYKSTKEVYQAYNLVRDTMNSMLNLAKYTSEAGARGSYDKLLMRLPDDRIKNLADNLGLNTEKGKKMALLAKTVDYLKSVDPSIALEASKYRLKGKGVAKITYTTDKSYQGKFSAKDTVDKMLKYEGKDFSEHILRGASPQGTYKGKTMYIGKDKELANHPMLNLGPRALKEMIMEVTQRLNKGGFVSRRY